MEQYSLRSIGIIGLLIISIFCGSGRGLTLEQGYFTDQAQILSNSLETSLSTELQQLEEETGAQIVVVTIDDLAGRDPFEVAFNFAQYETDTPDPDKYYDDGETGVGDAERDNGLLLLIAPNDRKRYAVTGRGLEGPLPDVYVKRLGENVLVPAFRAEDYDSGVQEFVSIAAGIVRGEFEERPYENVAQNDGDWMAILMFGIFVSIFVGGILKPSLKTDKAKYWGSGLGSVGYAGLASLSVGWSALFMALPLFLLWLFIIFAKPGSGGSSGWSSGGGFSGGGSFGGGSFGGFGGGSFSGGGAGGGW